MKFACTISLLVATIALASAAPEPFFGWFSDVVADVKEVAENTIDGVSSFVENGWKQHGEAVEKLENKAKELKSNFDEAIKNVQEQTGKIVGDFKENLEKNIEQMEQFAQQVESVVKEDVEKVEEQVKEVPAVAEQEAEPVVEAVAESNPEEAQPEFVDEPEVSVDEKGY